MISITQITCEHMINPLSVTTQHPRFSWDIQSDENDVYQKAYQIILNDTNGAIVWDSGRQESSQTVEIAYEA